MKEPDFPQSIGACIYCGQRDTELSKEHVIPFALGGKWLLEDASCAIHRDLTSALEHEVLRNAWGGFRTVNGFPTRRKKERPSVLPFKFGSSAGTPEVADVSVEEHPGSLVMPLFAPPGHPVGAPVVPGTSVVSFAVAHRNKKLAKLASALGADTVTNRYPEPLCFARFLAKVAHGFVVACFGVDYALKTPLLASFLSGDASIFQFVGNDDRFGTQTGTESEHEFVLAEEAGDRLVFIRLLAEFGAPEYIVRIDSPGNRVVS